MTKPTLAPPSCPHCIDETDCSSVDICNAVAEVYGQPTGATPQETAPRPAASRAIELAYGLLWRCATDRRTPDGERIHLARVALLGQLDQDGQARGIQLAQDMARETESRKNPRTDLRAPAK